MPQFFNISFTTRKEVISYDSKGKEIGRRKLDTPVTMNMLPLAAAMSYNTCDNFKIEEWVDTQPVRGRRTGIGNATKDPQRHKYDKPKKTAKETKPIQKPMDKHKSARTGDLSGAING